MTNAQQRAPRRHGRLLYVIGNGFDLHHGMATGYKHFGAFLKRDHSKLRDYLDEYFVTDDEDWFWGHFEACLADLDTDTLVDNFEQFIVPYSADDWSDGFHHDYVYELTRVVRALSEDLLAAFAQWIRQIAIPTPTSLMSPMARIDPTARFINFNYTNTLQQLYGVPDTHVWHIHGSAARTDPLILGHGWRPEPNETLSPPGPRARRHPGDRRRCHHRQLFRAELQADAADHH